jgi:Na+/H+ antiporter NhaD/arsenite permease-like protein
MLRKLLTFFQDDLLFTISLALALLTSFIGRFDIHFIDFQVVLTLFGLMLTINGLEKVGLLRFVGEWLVSKSHTLRSLIRTIVLLSFFSSMILTNDVAILTLLPMYLMITKNIKERSVLLGAVYLIVAANLGSSLFPFGNPQNLFLFSFYDLPLTTFLQTTGLMALLSLLLLVGSIQLLPATTFTTKKDTHSFDKNATVLYLGLMVLMILGIFQLIPFVVATIIVSLIIFIRQRELFTTVDYRLLGTFICFFIIVGNIKEQEQLIAIIQPIFQQEQQTFLGSIALSQVISNVPAAILIAPFTTFKKAVLLGVNVGGLGTLIASLANLIGYKLIKQSLPKEQKHFLKKFYQVNVLFLCIIGTIVYLYLGL